MKPARSPTGDRAGFVSPRLVADRARRVKGGFPEAVATDYGLGSTTDSTGVVCCDA